MPCEDSHRQWLRLLDCGPEQVLIHAGTGEAHRVHGQGSTLTGGPWDLLFSPEDRGVLVSRTSPGQPTLLRTSDVLSMSRHAATRDAGSSHGQPGAFIHNELSDTAYWLADECLTLTAHVFSSLALKAQN